MDKIVLKALYGHYWDQVGDHVDKNGWFPDDILGDAIWPLATCERRVDQNGNMEWRLCTIRDLEKEIINKFLVDITPAIEEIDSGCGSCIKSFCEDLNPVLEELNLRISSKDRDITISDLKNTEPRKHTKTSIEMISDERNRQIKKEGYSRDNDFICNNLEELAMAAAIYATPRMFHDNYPNTPFYWPWLPESYKPTPDDRIRELVKAGALIVAEIDRLRVK